MAGEPRSEPANGLIGDPVGGQAFTGTNLGQASGWPAACLFIESITWLKEEAELKLRAG